VRRAAAPLGNLARRFFFEEAHYGYDSAYGHQGISSDYQMQLFLVAFLRNIVYLKSSGRLPENL